MPGLAGMQLASDAGSPAVLPEIDGTDLANAVRVLPVEGGAVVVQLGYEVTPRRGRAVQGYSGDP